ncbi:hypothetical protein BPSY_2215 [Bifidobacterium psychraerophilum]|uniref:Uncharacterized protein n=1 Tax=Bifidobacterium psychraerophilum TaxID=218140 RepID=A0A087CJ55_9BIFI|nr:hypothetical protein BPSY_2215 [Bifidobacterium psychraerophilum]
MGAGESPSVVVANRTLMPEWGAACGHRIGSVMCRGGKSMRMPRYRGHRRGDWSPRDLAVSMWTMAG